MIRFAQDTDLPGLKALWQEAFHDSDEATESYFRFRHRNEYMLVEMLNDRLAGMLTMLPVELVSGGTALKARYIYGVATFEAFRGQGVSTRLLTHAHAFIAGRGEAAAILVPATPSLYSFYEKRGYETVFHMDVLTLPAEALAAAPAGARMRHCKVEDFYRLRNHAFSSSRLFARWNREALSYIMRTLDADSGSVSHLTAGKGEACAVWERQGDTVLIKELACFDMELKTALAILHQALDAKAYTLRLMEGSMQGAITHPFGMIHWIADVPSLSGDAPYLSLVMD